MTKPQIDEPFVSIIIPMLNEIRAIEGCIQSFDNQAYPHSAFELIIVDGGSTDGSRDCVEALRASRPWVRLIDNPERRASSAFNRGLEASTAPIVCIVGAHAAVRPDFIAKSVNTLRETGVAGVGGTLVHEGTTPKGNAIGLAMTSKFGMASPFRYATQRREVDTIGHPVYERSVLDNIGPFDESLERNSDYELNHRIRAHGYQLLLDPSITTIYRPRHSLSTLARQFFDYGRGKASVSRLHPESVKARHLVAPAVVILTGAAPLLTFSKLGRRLIASIFVVYSSAIIGTTIVRQPHKHGAQAFIFILAFPTMHLSWGAGFIFDALHHYWIKNRRTRIWSRPV